MGKPRNQFTFYRSYYDAIQELSKKDQSALILAVCAYAIYETLPKGLSNAASTAFKLIKPTLDSGRKKAESGSLGGASKPQAKESPRPLRSGALLSFGEQVDRFAHGVNAEGGKTDGRQAVGGECDAVVGRALLEGFDQFRNGP